jgi:hypothetical protein
MLALSYVAIGLMVLAAAFGLVGAGYFAWQCAVARPAFPPMDVADRIPWLGLLGLVLGLFESLAPGPFWTRWENRLVVVGVILWATLGPVLVDVEDARFEAIRAGVLAVAFLAFWVNLEALATARGVRALGPVLIATFAGAGVVFLLSGWAVGGPLAAGAAMLMGLVWLASAFGPGLSFARGTVPVVVSVLGGLLMTGYLYASASPWCAGLIAIAPVGAWLGRIGPVKRLRQWVSGLIALAGVLLFVAAAIGVAFAVSPSFGAEAYPGE